MTTLLRGSAPPKRAPRRLIEGAIVHAIRLRLNSIEGVICWRNSVGVDTRRGVRYGLIRGSADLICCVRDAHGVGRFVALEVKRPGDGVLAKHQAAWLAGVEAIGGVARVVTSTAEAETVVTEAMR